MAYKRKTWKEKMHNGREPEVDVLPRTFCGAPAGAKMLVSTPLEVDAAVRSVPRGRTISLAELRRSLALKHGALVACPTSTSIFVRICAECALEEMAAGASSDGVTPFWRVVDPKSPLAAKLSCGPEGLRTLRTAEGIHD